MAQDDYYYEIQLTNKQLVFYFMAGASGLILSFLAGVMVGRGVEGSAMGAVEARPLTEERVVAEQSPAPATSTPAPSGYSYPQRLESDKPDEGLEKKGTASAAPAAAHAPPAAARAATPPPAATHAASPSPAAARSQAPTLPPVPTPRPATTPAATTPAPAFAATPTPLPQPA